MNNEAHIQRKTVFHLETVLSCSRLLSNLDFVRFSNILETNYAYGEKMTWGLNYFDQFIFTTL